MSNLWGREPALVLAAIQAAVAALVAFGVDLTGDQTAAIMALSAAVVGLLVRRRVTPVP